MKWKIYAWLISILFVTANISDPEISNISDIEILRKIISIILILGVFCFAYRKVLFSQQFWKILFVVAVIDELWGVVEYKSEFELSVVLVISFILTYGILLPSFIAVYRYAFKLDELWAEND